MKLKYIFGRPTAIIESQDPLDLEAGVQALFIPCEGEEFDLIFINPDCANKPQALLHEELHAILNRIGINSTDLNPDVQEMICESVSTYLLEAYTLKPKG